MKTACHFANEWQPDDMTEHEIGHLSALIHLSHCTVAKLCSWHFLETETSARQWKGACNVQCKRVKKMQQPDGTLSWRLLQIVIVARAVYGGSISRKYASPMTSRSKCISRMLDAVINFLNSDTIWKVSRFRETLSRSWGKRIHKYNFYNLKLTKNILNI